MSLSIWHFELVPPDECKTPPRPEAGYLRGIGQVERDSADTWPAVHNKRAGAALIFLSATQPRLPPN